MRLAGHVYRYSYYTNDGHTVLVLRVRLDASVEILHGGGILVGARSHVPIHEQVSVVVLEQLVVHVVVSRSAKTKLSEKRVPRVRVLAVYQREPVGVEATECHVRPDVAVDQVGCDVQRN